MIVGLAYGKPAIIVDTHVARVSGRIGLTKNKRPERIEEDLKKIVPEAQWTASRSLHDPPRQVHLQGEKAGLPSLLAERRL